MPSILVMTFDSATGIRTGRLVGSALIEDNAVTSGKLGSGIIGPIHFAPFASGQVVLGQGSGLVPIYSVAPAVVADGGITSAKIAALAVGGPHIAWSSITSGKYTAESIRTADIGLAQIVSSLIGANIIGNPHIQNQGILSAAIGANVLATPHIQNQGILSASIGPTAIGTGHLATAAVVSGKLGDAAIHLAAIPDALITEAKLISGISIDIAEMNIEPGYRARVPISGFACVYIAAVSGNYVDTALAISGYMPAIGMTQSPIASGQLGSIIYAGRAAAPTSVVSGQYRRQVFVGTSGQLTITPPSTSGQCQQIMGVVKDNDAVMLFPEPGYIEIA